MKRALTIISLLLCLAGFAQSATPSPTGTGVESCSNEGKVDSVKRTDYRETFEIFYRFDSSKIDTTYLTNAEALAKLAEHLSDEHTLDHLDSLQLQAISSPDGPFTYNKSLSKRRATSLQNYLSTKYPAVKDKIRIGYSGEDWEGLKAMVEKSTKIPNKEQVLEIINSNLPLDTKEARLKSLDEGRSWRFITYNMLRYLRYGASAIFHYDLTYYDIHEEPEMIPEPEVAEEEPEPETAKEEPVTIPEPVPVPEPAPISKPLFALKTNLLFDAATILNVELEVPISNRWSVAGEWVFPWWTSCGNRNNSWHSSEDSGRNTLEILNGNLEAKYWLGNRTNRPVMTGWHVGLYAGGGKYDLERHAEGYQGEFFIAAGLSGGYAHTINKCGNLRMEYSLGLGYLKTAYRHYEEHWGIDDTWHTLRKNSGEYTWLGPTRARVSLVWLINGKQKGGKR